MLRKSDLLWLSVAAFAGVALFHTSYRVQELKEEMATLDRQIISEQDGIRVAKAEWGILNDPVRLEQLAGTYLTLTPITASQVAGFDALPPRPPGSPVTQPPSPALVSVAEPRTASRVASLAAAQERPSSASGAERPLAAARAALASAALPVQGHRAVQPQHPGAGHPLPLTHVSARATPVYAPAKDEIGQLLTRLGRIQ
jgi:hypothetical protein